MSSLIQISQRELTLINKEKRGQWYSAVFKLRPHQYLLLHPPPIPKTSFSHFRLFHTTNRTRPLSLTLLHIPAFLWYLLDDLQWGNCDFSTFVSYSYWCRTSTPSVRQHSATGAHFSCSHLSHLTEQYESVDQELVLFCLRYKLKKI